MKIAAAYIRVSTDEQVEFSPDSQIKKIREYAKQHDMTVPEDLIFADEGISGRTAEKRPAFQKMIGLSKVKPKPFDVIIVWKFSRFARNREDSIVYKSLLKKQGIDVVSVSEQLADDNSAVLMAAIYEAMDEYYSLNLAEEVKRGLNEKFSRGGIVSKPPFGYVMKNGTFCPDAENAEIVKKMYADYIEGKGCRTIAAELNSLGITTKKGAKWDEMRIEYILTNPTYTGKMRRSLKQRQGRDIFLEQCDIIQSSHEPLIDEETFQAVQNRRQQIKLVHSKYARSEPASYALKGLIRCAYCGSTFCYTKKDKGIQCNQYRKGICSVSQYITYKKLEDAVFSKLAEDLETDNFVFDIKPQKKPDNSFESLADNLIAKEEQKLQRVKEAYENGVDTLEEYKQNKQKIQQRIQELKKQAKPQKEERSRTEFKKQVKKTISLINSKNSTEAEKNTALRTIIEKVVFDKPNQTLKLFYKLIF